jgi:hypothetical protein
VEDVWQEVPRSGTPEIGFVIITMILLSLPCFCINLCLKSGMTLVPYFPDLAPYHFIPFPKLKLALKGKRLDDSITGELQSQVTPAKFKIQDFCKCFQ